MVAIISCHKGDGRVTGSGVHGAYKPVRRYYVHLERDAVVPIPRDQTTLRMHTDQVTLKVPVEDELDCKLELAEYTADKMEYRKDKKDWA